MDIIQSLPLASLLISSSSSRTAIISLHLVLRPLDTHLIHSNKASISTASIRLQVRQDHMVPASSNNSHKPINMADP
jgi:hypothetical protein